MSKFEVGKKYIGRSVCDYDCIVEIEVIKRTEKTITVNGDRITGTNKTLKITKYAGEESVKPYGSYSFAPIIRAV